LLLTSLVYAVVRAVAGLVVPIHPASARIRWVIDFLSITFLFSKAFLLFGIIMKHLFPMFRNSWCNVLGSGIRLMGPPIV
jgi:hypothetical protein